MEFEVKTEVLKKAASEEKEMKKTLRQISSDIEDSKRNLHGAISESVELKIGKSVEKVRERIDYTSEKLGKMGDKLDEIAAVYANTEKELTEERLQA